MQVTEAPFTVYDLVSIIPNIIVGLLTIRAYCLVLDLRSNRVFAVCHLLNVTANIMALKLGWPLWLRVFFINPSTTLIMPIAYSRGALSMRIIRVLTILLIVLPAEAASVGTYMLLGNRPYFSTIDESNYVDIGLTYCVTVLLGTLLIESLIFFYRRADRELDADIAPAILANMFACYLLSLIIDIRIIDTMLDGPVILATVGLVALIEAAYALSTITVAHRDAVSKRILADEAARARQARHVKQAIEASTLKAGAMRRLRHDLANQVDLVYELAESGHTHEASQYLDDLRSQIQDISGDVS